MIQFEVQIGGCANPTRKQESKTFSASEPESSTPCSLVKLVLLFCLHVLDYPERSRKTTKGSISKDRVRMTVS